MRHIRKYDQLSRSHLEYLTSPQAANKIIVNTSPIYIRCQKPSKDALKPIYRQLNDGDYIIQPKFMLEAGSMCVTELYSKALRKRLVHELLFKEKMETILPKFKEHKERYKWEVDKLKERLTRKHISKNISLLKYEKNHLCNHNNTDGSGSLLRNLSSNQRLLKTNVYLRGKEYLKRIEDRNSVMNNKVAQVKNDGKKFLLKRLKSSDILNANRNKKYELLIKRYEKNIGIMQKSLKYY